MGVVASTAMGCQPQLTPLPGFETGDESSESSGSGEDDANAGSDAGDATSGSATAGEGGDGDGDAGSGDGDGDGGDGDGGDGDGGDGDGGDGTGGDGDGDGDPCPQWNPPAACTGTGCVAVQVDWVHCVSSYEHAVAGNGSVLMRDSGTAEMLRIDPGGGRVVLPNPSAAPTRVFPNGEAYVVEVDLGQPTARLDRYDRDGALIVSNPAWYGAAEQMCGFHLTHEAGTIVVERGIDGFPGLGGCTGTAMHLMRADGSEVVAFVDEPLYYEYRSNQLGLYRYDTSTGYLDRLDLSVPSWWVAPVWSGFHGRVGALAEDVDHLVTSGSFRVELIDGMVQPSLAEGSSGDVAIDPTGTWWAEVHSEFDETDWISSARLYTANALVLEREIASESAVSGLDVNERGEMLVASADNGVRTVELIGSDGTVEWVSAEPSGIVWIIVGFQAGGDAFVLRDAGWGTFVRMEIER
jgi:hypothetical protein